MLHRQALAGQLARLASCRSAGSHGPQPVSCWRTVGGLRLHARLGGWEQEGDPVVLVHGLGVSSLYMVPTLRALMGQVRVAAPDLPGFGRSDGTPEPLDIPELADWLLRWMDAMGIQSAALVGNSMGCQIIVDLAVRHPGRVGSAILVGPTLDPALRHPLTAVWRLAVDTLREAPSQPFLVAYDYLRFGPRRLWRTYRLAAADDVHAKLPRVRAHTLVVRGARDPIATGPWAASIVQRIPAAELVVVAGAAHTVNYMAPDVLARLIVTFIGRTRRDAGIRRG